MAPRTNKALEAAETRALQGENESQDSQMIEYRWRSEYGIGLTSSSPVPGEAVQLPTGGDKIAPPPVSFPQPAQHHKVIQRYVGPGTGRSRRPHLGRPANQGAREAASIDKDHEARATVDASRASHHSTHTTTLAIEQEDTDSAGPRIDDDDDDELNTGVFHDVTTNNAGSSQMSLNDGDFASRGVDHSQEPVEAPDPLVRTDTLPRLPPSGSPTPGKMESSQQSPTQSNDGRSYEKYRHSSFVDSNLPSAALVDNFDRSSPSPSHETSPGHRTLNEDDPGAVRFSLGLFGNLRSHDSQLSAPETSAGLTSTTDDHPQWPALAAPETPAPPKNPFAAQNPAMLLGGSQMFGQTQFSSAFRHISPTSSRPSPDAFHNNNSISPNPIISSPLKTRGLRTSPITAAMTSPQVPFSTSSRSANEPETPYQVATTGSPLISHSPKFEPPERRPGPELMDVYEPMRNSQERRETLELQASPTDSDEDLSEDENDRRRRARSKKAKAEKHLSSINFSRPSASVSEDVEVPSTNKKAKSRSRTPAEEYVAQCRGKSDKDDETQETVADSQEQPVINLRANEAADLEEAILGSPVGSDRVSEAAVVEAAPAPSLNLTREVTASSLPGPTVQLSAEESNADAIPETSPADARPRPIGDILKQASGDSSKPVSFPAMSSIQSDPDLTPNLFHISRQSSTSSRNRAGLHPEGNVMNEEEDARDAGLISAAGNIDGKIVEGLSSAHQEPEASSSPEIRSSPPALRTRARSRVQNAATGKLTPFALSSSAPPGALSSTSVLSSLSTTPALSNKTTPLTQDTVSARRSNRFQAAVVAESSPAVAKVRRRDGVDALSKLKSTTIESARNSTRLTRKQMQREQSIDELAGSPPATPPAEYSLRNSRAGRGLVKKEPGSREQSSRGAGIFNGMSFAISFQSRRQGEGLDQYNERMEQAKSIEKKIHQGGGRILHEGFDELFETPPMKSTDASPTTSQPDDELTLTSDGASGGFAALVADGHSRKVKYMQALALGLPCIASRWIMACFEKQEIVDWSPYLLCAGASSFLGDAIRSRNLTPYDAKTARLCDVLDHRTRLLEGNRILLIMKKSGDSKRMAYVFLARVLGACLSRVYSIDDAKAKLKAAEDAGQPFDWVYVDEKTAGKGDLFLSKAPAEAKKRKRGSTDTYKGPPPKKVRTLSDELVVQSLIFGSIIGEGEMDE